MRRRLHLHTPLLAYATRGLTLLLAGILIWYGAMVVLLAAKVSPHTVNSLSAYRSIYDFLVRLRTSDFSVHRRRSSTWRCKSSRAPNLTRPEGVLRQDDFGLLRIQPRAIERLAETAALMSPDVGSVSGRLGEQPLYLGVGIDRAQGVAEALCDERHELPELAANVTVTKFEPATGRNLS